jgi:hypothetical protein
MRRELLLAFSGLLAACAAGATLAGCPTTTTTASYTPVTGILIRSSSLVAGHGCGLGPGQIYKYVAVLFYAPDAGGPVGTDGGPTAYQSGVFDCFTDGLFSNLPATAAGGLDFTLNIYAFDKDAFPTQLDCPPGGSAMPDAAPCPGDVPDNVTEAITAAATWTTSCTATEQSGVSVLAVCDPLQTPGSEAGADTGASADTGADAGADTSAGADADASAGADAGADALAETGDDAAPDASGDAGATD